MKAYLLAGILVYASVVGGLGILSKLDLYAKKPVNTVEEWIKGYLSEGSFLKLDIQTTIGEGNPKPLQDDISFFVAFSNATLMVITTYQIAYFGNIPQLSVVQGVVLYKPTDFYLFPFTINLPLLEDDTYVPTSTPPNTTVEWRLLQEKKGWDTHYSKIARVVNGSIERVEEWMLDEDTHLMKHVHIVAIRPTFNVTIEITVDGGSGEIKRKDELTFLSSLAGFIGIIVGGSTLLTLLYQRRDRTVQEEKERIQSETYRKEFVEKHEEKGSQRRP